MADQNLNIVIGANVSGAQQGLETVSKSLASTAVAANKLDSGLSKSANAAGFALTNLGRVASDLPFGFVAIQNNLVPLLESFQRFQQEAKNSGGVVKSLAGALSGASGVTLALSLASSAWLIYSKYQQQAAKTTDELGDALAKSGASLNTELTKLSGLVSVARDYSESQSARLNAINELQKLYPGYLSNLNLENVNSQETAFAIEKLTDALARKAKVQAYSNLLTKAQEDLIKAQNSKLQDNVSLFDHFVSILKSGGNLGTFITKDAIAGAENQADAIADLQKAVDSYSHALSDLTREQAKNNDFKLFDPTKAAKALKEFKTAIVSFDIHAGRVTPLQDTSFEKINKEIGDYLAKHPLKPVVTLKPKLTLGEQGAAAIDATFGLLQEQLISGFAALGESLGNALTGAKNPFGTVLDFLSAGLKTIGKAYIEIGTSMLVAKKALKLILESPILTIAAGVALVALSSILQNKANSVKAFAAGGVVTRPTLALVGEAGPERITPLNSINNSNNNWGGQVEFVISGQTLRGILRRADQTAYNTF